MISTRTAVRGRRIPYGVPVCTAEDSRIPDAAEAGELSDELDSSCA
ncbi:hypothetical protein [Saccharopolyspora elongata]|nr:hypothetical protein [Saccharopolyspora elongata]